MKKTLFAIFLLPVVAACMAQHPKTPQRTNNMEQKNKSLVAFFSRAGENYSVGYIEKGNTQIVAETIASETGADLFHIEPLKPYPTDYARCIEAAKLEKQTNARPAIKEDISVENYDTIFLGYPNWWGEMPMAVYTFIEKHNWHGKTVIPFCTHEGSGLSDTESHIRSACKGGKILQGLAIRGTTAQHDSETTRKAVIAWLKKLNMHQTIKK